MAGLRPPLISPTYCSTCREQWKRAVAGHAVGKPALTDALVTSYSSILFLCVQKNSKIFPAKNTSCTFGINSVSSGIWGEWEGRQNCTASKEALAARGDCRLLTGLPALAGGFWPKLLSVRCCCRCSTWPIRVTDNPDGIASGGPGNSHHWLQVTDAAPQDQSRSSKCRGDPHLSRVTGSRSPTPLGWASEGC